MKKALNTSLKLFLIGILFLINPFITNGQKLPNVQEISLRTPATIKVDGKLLEWDGLLKAYNKSTLVEYTIANDDQYLYLAISSRDQITTAKILAGGISFIMNTSGKRSLNQGSVITFPSTNSTYIYPENGWPTKTFIFLTDSIRIRKAIPEFKEIKGLRLKGIPDSILSIYNEYGIKAKIAYANEILIYELSIPFNLIGLSLKDTAAFAYNIKLNGVPIPPRSSGDPVPKTFFPLPGELEPMLPGEMYISREDINYPTDFWGEYTLAK